jgi:hypothetical protein
MIRRGLYTMPHLLNSALVFALTLMTTPLTSGARFNLPAAAPGGVKQEHISPAQARLSIEKHITLIENRRKEMRALYDNGPPARKTMEQALVRYGASPQKASDSSATWVYTVWSDASQFYAFHLAALGESLSAIQSKGYALPGDLEYLDGGMRFWSAEEEKLRNLMQQCVDLRGQYGAFYEKYFAYRTDYYPGGHNKTTTFEDYMRQLDAERKQRENDEAVVDSGARSYARKRVFEALRRIDVLSGKEPGANDRQQP